MAPTPPPATKPKGKGNLFTKKYGPFSGWVWLVMVGGSVAVWFMLRGRSAGGFGGPEIVTGADASPQEQAGAGQPSQNSSPGSQLDPSVLDSMGQGEYYADNKLRMAAMELTDQIRGIQSQIDDAAYAQYTDTGYGYTPDGPASPTVAATLGAPGKRPAQKNAILWGGSVYGKGTGGTFIAEQLRPKGVSPSSWAKKHPEAAAYLGIPKTSPAARKAAPARPAPKQIAPKRAPVKAPARVAAKVQPKQVAKAAAPKKQPPRPAPKPAPKRAPAKKVRR